MYKKKKYCKKDKLEEASKYADKRVEKAVKPLRLKKRKLLK